MQPRQLKNSARMSSSVRLLNAVLGIYIEVFRGTPMIVQAMVIYYGSMQMGLRMPVLVAAVLVSSISTLRLKPKQILAQME